MKSDRKPRSDSPLNRLTPDRQQAVIEYLETHGTLETVAWLRQDGVHTNPSSLGAWRSSFLVGAQLRRNEAAVETMVSHLRTEHPDWTPAQVQELGQAFFSGLAIEQQDPKGWFLTQQLALKKEQLAFDRDRFKEALRTKLQSGLDAVADAFRGNTQAMDLYRQARALVDKETA